MPVDDTAHVDAIGVDRRTGEVVLTVFDAWDWTNEREHLYALQSKLNTYFDFIQSGQINEAYPASLGRRLAIQVATKYPLSASGKDLLRRAAIAASQINVTVRDILLRETDGGLKAESQNSSLSSE